MSSNGDGIQWIASPSSSMSQFLVHERRQHLPLASAATVGTDLSAHAIAAMARLAKLPGLASSNDGG